QAVLSQADVFACEKRPAVGSAMGQPLHHPPDRRDILITGFLAEHSRKSAHIDHAPWLKSCHPSDRPKAAPARREEKAAPGHRVARPHALAPRRSQPDKPAKHVLSNHTGRGAAGSKRLRRRLTTVGRT